MTQQEFDNLFISWLQTPEYRKYEDLCFSCHNFREKVDQIKEIAEAMHDAFNNEYGKQLKEDSRFWAIVSGERITS